MRFRDSKKDVVQSDAFALTKGSAVAAAIVALATGIEPVFDVIFGKGVSEADLTNERAAIVIAAIGAWALIAAVDLLARSYVTSQSKPRVTAIPHGLTATKTKGVDEPGYTVAAIRSGPGTSQQEQEIEFLLIKAGKEPEWVSSKDLRFS